MRRDRRLVELALASVLVIVASSEVAAQREPRRPYAARLSPLFSLVSDDRVLLSPVHLVAGDSAIYLMEMAERQLVAFSYDGRRLWAVGREGSGPGEHRVITSLALDHRTGDLWQYDLGNGRIQVRARDGRLKRSYPARRTLFKVAPLADGRFAGVPGGGGGTFLHVYDGASGDEVQQVPPPLEEYADPMFSFAASAWVAPCPAGQLVIGYAYASYLHALPSQLHPPVVRDAIDPVTPPRSVEVPLREGGRTLVGHRRAPDAKRATNSITCDRARVLVLYVGSTSEPGRTVDVYRLTDLAYLGSFELPEPVLSISVHGDRLVALRLDPVPALFAWRVTWP